MANVKISGLPAASAVADANEFEINEAGTSKKVTGSQIASYVSTEIAALTSSDLGVTVQPYDVDTAKYDATTANFTGTLQNGGSNVLVDTDIGSTVQAYDANILTSSDIGSTVQGYDATILTSSDIGTSVQAYDADTAKTDVSNTFSVDQAFSGKVGIGGASTYKLDVSGLTRSTGYLETVYTLSGTTPAINITNGNVQLWTLTGNSTPTGGPTASSSITLMIDDGSAYTITWTSVVDQWIGGSAPTLATTGYSVIELWEVSGVVYGAYVGDAS